MSGQQPQRWFSSATIVALALCVAWPHVRAQGRLHELAQRMRDRRAQATEPMTALAPGVDVVRDVAYGPDPRQRFDVYRRTHAKDAPVILLVHGGGWTRGDKRMRGIVENKVAHWVPAGFIVVSANYRMLPGTKPDAQAGDIAMALAVAQRQARSWGGDPDRFVLVGHSAGGHLVALLSAAPRAAHEAGARRWLGTVVLDSAGMDVEQVMRGRHMRLYDDAFGSDSPDWRAASPYHALSNQAVPMLLVCSTLRQDSCPQSKRFVARAAGLGVRAEVFEVPLSHAQVNTQLGLRPDYTHRIDAFLRTLDPVLARHLP